MRHPATRLLVFTPAMAALAMLGLACASTKPVRTQVDDAAIKTLVFAKLTANGKTNPFEIDVAVSEGVVHLTGFVDEVEDRDEADKEARSVAGVREVINDLRVGNRVGDETAGEALDDAAITARVKAKLAASAELNPFDVDVNTVHGVVSLMGRVETAQQKAAAERIAGATSGVRQVDNLLEVGDLR